jgi:hypothetical protein
MLNHIAHGNAQCMQSCKCIVCMATACRRVVSLETRDFRIQRMFPTSGDSGVGRASPQARRPAEHLGVTSELCVCCGRALHRGALLPRREHSPFNGWLRISGGTAAVPRLVPVVRLTESLCFDARSVNYWIRCGVPLIKNMVEQLRARHCELLSCLAK